MGILAAARSLEAAQELLEGGKPDEALRALRSPFPAALRIERDFLTGEALRAQGFFRRAAPFLLRVLRSGGDPSLRIEACLALAALRRSLGETGPARRFLSQARRLSRRGAPRGLGERIELEEALADRAEGLYRKSLSKLGKLLSSFRRRGDWAAAAFVLWAMGGARRFAGDLEGSRRDFTSSLSSSRRAGDRAGAAYALLGLGGVSRIQGRLKDSRAFYARAAALFDGGPDLFGRAYAHCGLANALRQSGDLGLARRHYLRAHGLYSRLEDPLDLAYVDWGLGKIALQRGELREAQRRLGRSLAAFRKGGETRGEVLSEVALAALLHARGRTARAEAIFGRCVKRARDAGIHSHLEVFT